MTGIYFIFGVVFVAQMMATAMWLSGIWLYKTDAVYRVHYGWPSFWFWNQIWEQHKQH